MYKAMNEPAMPINMVMMQPAGSLPGVINFAMTPMTSPMIIVPIKPRPSAPWARKYGCAAKVAMA